MSIRKNIIRATYTAEDIFKIPPHIDLENKSQVKYWFVKWNILTINLTDGDCIEISSEYDEPSNFDWKSPDETALLPDEGEYCLDWSEYEEEEEEEEESVAVSPIEEIKLAIEAKIDEKLKDPSLEFDVGFLLRQIKDLQLKHYIQMNLIRDWLFTIEAGWYDEEFDVPAEMKEKIYGVGLLIHMEGGFQLQQECFYLAVNFMDDEKKRLKAIELCWSGAGEWKY